MWVKLRERISEEIKEIATKKGKCANYILTRKDGTIFFNNLARIILLNREEWEERERYIKSVLVSKLVHLFVIGDSGMAYYISDKIDETSIKNAYQDYLFYFFLEDFFKDTKPKRL